ncbi:MAG: hypothetical protein ACRDKW_00770, partial [Actinomycetota bacterium]
TVPASGYAPVLLRTHHPGLGATGTSRLRESQLASVPGGEEGPSAASMVTLLLSGILGCVDDRRRALELAAGLVAASTGATLCAIGVRGPTGFAVVGEEAGLPLRQEREKELARFLAGRGPGGGEVFDIWGQGADPLGHAVVWQEGGLGPGDRARTVAVLGMLGSWLDARAARIELRTRAAEEDGLRARLAREESARLLVARVARHLAALDVEALLDDLGRALGGEAALVSVHGMVLAGSPAATAMVDDLCARRGWRSTATERGGPATLVPLGSGEDGMAAYLALRGATTGLDSVAWEPLEGLLSAAAALRVEGLDATFGSEPAFLLAALLSGEDFPPEELQRWARRLGIDLSAAHRVAFLTPAPGHLRRATEALCSVRTLLQ